MGDDFGRDHLEGAPELIVSSPTGAGRPRRQPVLRLGLPRLALPRLALPRLALQRLALQRLGLARLGLALLAASCAPDLPPLADTPAFPYQLGTGDQVRIITFGEAQLTGQFRVNDSGNVAVPLLGTVPAAGLTTSQLQDEIAEALQRRKLITTPSVSVEVTTFRPIFVLGEVSKPGQYPYQPGMTVLVAVAIAGGFTYSAVERHALVLRRIDGHAVESVAGRGTRLHPGDVVTIEERYF